MYKIGEIIIAIMSIIMIKTKLFLCTSFEQVIPVTIFLSLIMFFSIKEKSSKLSILFCSLFACVPYISMICKSIFAFILILFSGNREKLSDILVSDAVYFEHTLIVFCIALCCSTLYYFIYKIIYTKKQNNNSESIAKQQRKSSSKSSLIFILFSLGLFGINIFIIEYSNHLQISIPKQNKELFESLALKYDGNYMQYISKRDSAWIGLKYNGHDNIFLSNETLKRLEEKAKKYRNEIAHYDTLIKNIENEVNNSKEYKKGYIDLAIYKKINTISRNSSIFTFVVFLVSLVYSFVKKMIFIVKNRSTFLQRINLPIFIISALLVILYIIEEIYKIIFEKYYSSNIISKEVFLYSFLLLIFSFIFIHSDLYSHYIKKIYSYIKKCCLWFIYGSSK